MQLRQGDIGIFEVASLPPDTRVVPRDNGRIVLAYGESSGHAHEILEPDATLHEDPQSNERYLRVVSETEVLHPEHAPITLEPALYKVVRQREYTPGEVRPVFD
jgi:hypothetical protein